jgi:hypothetical protein
LNIFSGKIKAKSFFLIQLGGGTVGADLPEADFIGNLNLSATNGRVALCNNNVALLPTSLAIGENIVDFVGYGNAITFEGMAAVVLSNTTSLERKANAASTEVTMAANGVDILAGNGYDTNNNSIDLVKLNPNPQNSKSPAEGSTSTSPSIIVSPSNINFGNVSSGLPSEAIRATIVSTNLTKPLTLKATTDFLISRSSNGPYGDTIVFSNAELNNNKAFFIVFTPIATGNYTGSVSFESAEVNSIPKIGLSGKGLKLGDYLFDFANCNTGLSDGFVQYSVTGAQQWLCSTFGRDDTDTSGKSSKASGLQISGFQTVANANIDWLISPEIQLLQNTSFYPTLTFYSRTRFAGPSLSIRLSTNYQKGEDPTLSKFIWEDINVKFPATDSDTWTNSGPIDLGKYRGKKITLAWVYTSSAMDAPRWSIDDIEISHKNDPPVGALNLSTKSLYYGFVKPSTTLVDSVSIEANPFEDDLTISVASPYSLSVNKQTYVNSMVVKSSQNTLKTKIFVSVNPLIGEKSYIDTIFIKVDNKIIQKIHVNSNTFDQQKTLDVISYNIEWFGGINGPVNDSLQVENVKTLLKKVNGDIYGLTEIVDTADLKLLTESLGAKKDDFGYFVSKYASNVSSALDPNYPNSQKLAFIFRKENIKPIKIEPLFFTTDISSTSYNNWTSGRFPYALTAEVTLGNIKKEIVFILIHGKAQNSADAHSRRKNAAQSLHAHILSNLKDNNVIILGDYNDDLDETVGSQIQVGTDWPNSSYQVFVTDTTNFSSLTLPLSIANESSTARFNNVIDHIIVSKNLQASYLKNSTQILDEFANSIPNYSTTTTDHYPVKSRFVFETITNIDQLSDQSTIAIYPNPSQGTFFIDATTENGKFEIYDLSGKLLSSYYLTNNERVLNLEHLKSGMYVAIYKSGKTLKKINIVKI